MRTLRNLRALSRNVWVTTITSFLTDISSEMIVHLIPLFLANVLGVRTAIIGLIDGVAETTASLLKLYSGALSDRIGRYKWMAVAGYGISTLAKPFLAIADSWFWVLGVRFADRVGKGVRNPPRDVLVANSVDETYRGLAFGVHRAGDTFGAFVGLGLAATIVMLVQSGQATLLDRSTFQIAVWISLIPAVLAVLILALGAREVTSRASPARPMLSLQGFDRRFKWFLGIVVLFTLGNSSDSFIVLRGQERGLSVTQVMLMVMTFNLIYALLAGPLGSLSDHLGRRRILLFGWLAYGLVYLGLAFAQSGWHVWTLFGLYGVYYAATEVVAKALIADLVPENLRGSAYGLHAAAVGLTALPASLIAGVLWQGVGSWSGFGAPAPFIFGAILALLAAGLFWQLIK